MTSGCCVRQQGGHFHQPRKGHREKRSRSSNRHELPEGKQPPVQTDAPGAGLGQPCGPAPAPSQEGGCLAMTAPGSAANCPSLHSGFWLILGMLFLASNRLIKNHVSRRLRDTERLELSLKWSNSTDRQPSDRAIEISFCIGTMAPPGEA